MQFVPDGPAPAIAQAADKVLVKRTRERLVRAVTGIDGQGEYVGSAVSQHPGSLTETPGTYVTCERTTNRNRERAREMKTRDSDRAGDGIQR